MSDQQFEPACRRMEWLDPFYKAVWEKAYEDAIPISGTFELTPRCNFNCRMCYVHLPESEIHKHGRELSAGEWKANGNGLFFDAADKCFAGSEIREAV